MKILVTNDDGIHSKGLSLLVDWAKKLGEVTVCAPAVQQSAKSHAINIHDSITAKRTNFAEGVRAYVVHSTPVDCVRFGTLGLREQYDLVLSGVNQGFNMGEDILYSGTVANVFEAALRGCRGIAFSTDPTSWDEAQAKLDFVWQYLTENDLFAHCGHFNVNIPLNSKGIKWTKQGGAYFTDEFVCKGDDKYSQEGYSVYEYGENLALDTDAVMNGYISVTPLSIRRDDVEVWEKVKLLQKTSH